jgi:hypothetical protein
VLLSPNVSVPPLWVDGLTTFVTAALDVAAEPDVPVPPLLPPPQAARASAASPPDTASQMVLRLFKTNGLPSCSGYWKDRHLPTCK